MHFSDSQEHMPICLAKRERLSESIAQLSFELEQHRPWRPGQCVELRRQKTCKGQYSIASIFEEDYYLTIHVKRRDNGEMGQWLCDELEIGNNVEAHGPVGTCYYEPKHRERNILLVGTDDGLAPLYGICRDALLHGHTGQLALYHGSKTLDGIYLQDELSALAEEYENVAYTASVSKGSHSDVLKGQIESHAFKGSPDLSDWLVFLCGSPELVHAGHAQAVLAGAKRDNIKDCAFLDEGDESPHL
jgi:ferredoxin-NADP reductase